MENFPIGLGCNCLEGICCIFIVQKFTFEQNCILPLDFATKWELVQ